MFTKAHVLKNTLSGVIFCAMLSCIGHAKAAQLPELVLNDSNDPPFTQADGKGFLDVVAGEAFRRAGVKLRLVKLPAERALLNANAGIEDGELSRIAGLEGQYPNLVRVSEKIADWEFSAFSRDAAISTNLDVLRQHPIGHIKGWKIYEGMMAGAPTVVTAEDSTQLFRLLDLRRVEVVLYMRWMGLAKIREQGLHGIVLLEPPLATREMFIYLHKRHIDLAPKIAAALRDLKKEGFYQRQFREKVLISVGPHRK